jgi:hypothetical protein
MSSPHATLVVQYLSGSDDRCPRCGYALRGCASHQCPECGLPLRLALARGPGLTWWLMAMFGPAVCVVMSLLLLVPLLSRVQHLLEDPHLALIVRGGMAPARELPSWAALVVATLLLVSCGALLAFAAAARSLLARMPPLMRAGLALALLLSPLLYLGIVRLLLHLAA